MPTPAQEKMKKYAERFTPEHSFIKHLVLAGLCVAFSFIIVLAYNYFFSLSAHILFVATLFLYIFPAFFVSTAFSYYPIGLAPLKIRLLAVLYGLFTYYLFFFFFTVLKFGSVVFSPVKLFVLFSYSFISITKVFDINIAISSNISSDVEISGFISVVLVIYLIFLKKSDFLQTKEIKNH